jgi:hypothetical protein
MKLAGMIIIALMVIMTLTSCKSSAHCDAYGNKAAIH